MPPYNFKALHQSASRKGLYGYGVAVLAVTILILSVVPGFGGGINSGLGAHGSAYFVFSFVIILYLRSSRAAAPLIKAALAAGAYGTLIEAIQYFIPYRMFDAADILVNFSAAVLACIPGFALIRKDLI